MGLNLNHCLKLLGEIAHRARDIHAARNSALAVLYALDDARRLLALGTVGRLRRVHFLLAITSFCDLCHRSGVSPSWGVSAHTRKTLHAASTSRSSTASASKTIAWRKRDSLPPVYIKPAGLPLVGLTGTRWLRFGRSRHG